ncbi:MAG: hypothetical protein HON70_23550, partial [Lentisphaerae bacterium]|nr:hypothetical protein [Lentisphaerota bacterium]
MVALCVRTMGKRRSERTVTEIAAIVLEEGQITETFHRVPRPGGPITPSLMRQTGLSREELAEQPSIDAVMAEFVDVVPTEALCVSHGAKGLRTLLRRLTDNLFKNRILDTLAFAGVCLPTAGGYSLSHLADASSLEHSDAPGALGDARLTIKLWHELSVAAERLPLPILIQISGLLTPLRSDPLQKFFRNLSKEKHRSCPKERGHSLATLFPTIPFPKRRGPEDGDAVPVSIGTGAIAAVFEPTGLLATHLPAFEYRAEQRDMALAVTEALNASKHTMIEAGTGIGKSLAYLVPSILFSLRNDTPFVISTNTKNLQSQLFSKDLPLLQKALDTPFRAALIKGRKNYLCLRKLLYLLDNADVELERDERLPMASVVCWAGKTESGDVSESVVGSRPHLSQLASRLTSVAEECPGPACPHYRKCFLQKARRRALSADVIVANHSVVFSEMSMPLASPVLPPYQHIVFDEAHNLEDAITNTMAAEVSERRILFVLRRLWRTGRRKRKRGLLATVAKLLSEIPPDCGGDARELALSFAAAAGDSVDNAQTTLDPFFNALAALLPHEHDRQSRRLRPERRLPEKWEPIMAAKKTVVAALAEVGEAVDGLIETLAELTAPLPNQDDLARELKACVLWNGEATQDMEMVLAAKSPDYVYWVEHPADARSGARAWAAPINVAPLMFEHLYSAKRAVVFTSATLTVQGSTSFVEKRLGIHLVDPERMTRLTIGTPFNYPRQCLVLVP